MKVDSPNFAATEKKRVAFFFDSAPLMRGWSFDLRTQALSGTDSLAVLVASHFSVHEKLGHIFSTSAPSEPSAAVTVVNDLTEAATKASQLGFDYLVFNARSSKEQKDLLKAKQLKQLRLIPWLQNSPDPEYLLSAWRSRAVYRLVCVSNVQAFNMTQFKASLKFVVIPNAIDTDFWERAEFFDRKVVTYVGALKASKGFHLLAEAWASVRQNHPEWELHVCGSPGLYGATSEMGPEGIAEKEYERRILAPLGGTLAGANAMGVEFLGSLSKTELRSQLRDSSIAAVNPSVRGGVETFCVSAVEASSLGLPVVGGAAGGLLEVVGHRLGGLLSSSPGQLSDNICQLIESKALRKELGATGSLRARTLFSQTAAFEKWSTLFNPATADRLAPSGDLLMPRDMAQRKVIRAIVPPSVLSGLTTWRRRR